MKRLQHGILTDDGILISGGWKGSKIQMSNISTLSDICDLAKQFDLLQVWIMNGTKIFNRCALNHRKFMQSERYGFAPKEIKNLITVWGNGIKSQIVFCGELEIGSENNLARENLITQWQLWEIKDAKRLFSAVAWLYEKLNVYPSIPIRTAKRLAEISAKETLDMLVQDVSIFRENKSVDLIYLDLAKAKGKKYIHGFDKNSAYLAAAASYPFGLGESILQRKGEFNKEFHGLWKCEINTDGINGEKLKFIEQITDGQERLWTSDVSILIELGAKIKVIDANIWKYNKRIFEKFYKLLNTAITEAKENNLSYERSSLKAIYTRFFGYLNKNPNGRDEIFYRPDWYSAIIAQTKANIVRNIFTIRGAMPEMEIIGCHRDELFFATNEKDISNLPFPLQAVGARKAPFKHTWSFEFEVENTSAILATATGAADLSKKLKAVWTEKKTNEMKHRLDFCKLGARKYAQV